MTEEEIRKEAERLLSLDQAGLDQEAVELALRLRSQSDEADKALRDLYEDAIDARDV